MTITDLTDSTPEPDEAGKGGEGGVFMTTNAEFIVAVFPQLPEGAFAAVCSAGLGLMGFIARRRKNGQA
jgi:hypothetical protein